MKERAAAPSDERRLWKWTVDFRKNAMNEKPPHRARIASHVPGRLRVRVGHGRHNPAALNRIKRGLEVHKGIGGVEVNPATGSVTVRYDPKRHSEAGVLGLLKDVDVLVESLTHVPTVAEAGADAAATPTVGEAIDDLNARFARWSGLPIDLRTVLPLAFMGAGLWSILRNGLMLEKVPGWLLLWLGFDLFVKTRPHDAVRTASGRKDTKELSD
jgi:copper chaperone CopZ